MEAGGEGEKTREGRSEWEETKMVEKGECGWVRARTCGMDRGMIGRTWNGSRENGELNELL